jgi:hypothetical protein
MSKQTFIIISCTSTYGELLCDFGFNHEKFTPPPLRETTQKLLEGWGRFFFMTKGSCIASNNLTRDSGKLLGVGKWACQSKDSLYLIENILMVKYSKSNTIHTLNESNICCILDRCYLISYIFWIEYFCINLLFYHAYCYYVDQASCSNDSKIIHSYTSTWNSFITFPAYDLYSPRCSRREYRA